MTRADLRVLGMIGLLGGSGALHLVVPRVYEQIIPPVLGNPRAWVIGSGVVELACAGAVALPRTRRDASLASAALFVAVFPANVYSVAAADSAWLRAAMIARLPLQVPLVLLALRTAREARPRIG